MMRWAWASLCLTALLATGCAAGRNDFIRLNAGTQFSARAPDAPIVLTVSGLSEPYQEIGVIHVSGISREGYDTLNEKLRAKARAVGADAVIYVHYDLENVGSVIPFFVAIPYNVLTAEGVAVRTHES
jgi:hypothetical protein